jgi:lysophospholipase L1-like esterase
MHRSSTPWHRKLLLLGASGVICFGLLEIGVRVLDPEDPYLDAKYSWFVGTHLIDMTKDEFRERQRRIYRVRAEQNMERGRDHPIYGWTYNPMFRIDEPDLEVHINEHALRGPSFPIIKPEGEIRVMCIGGSTTAGEEVGEADTYPAQLEAILRERFPDRAIRVINAGIPSYDTVHSLLHYELRLWRFDPDIVTIYHGINDLVRHRRGGTDIEPVENFSGRSTSPHVMEGDAPLRASVWADTKTLLKHSRVLRRMLWEFERRSGGRTRVAIAEPDPDGIEEFVAYYGALVRHIHASDAIAVPMTFALAWPGKFDESDRQRVGASLDIWLSGQGISRDVGCAIIDAQNDAIRDLAGAEQCVLCDAAAAVPPDREHFVDVCHLTAAGNRAIAECLADALSPLLDQLGRENPAHE